MRQSESQGEAERVLGMASAIRYYEKQTGHKPGRSTWWRWLLTNRLESRRNGGRIYTTESAIRRMIAADEQRNRGSVNARGQAAAERIEQIATSMPRRSARRKGGRR